MPTDGTTGAYSLPNDPVQNKLVSGVMVSDGNALETVFADVVTALSDRLSRTGKGGMLAALAMGGNKVTGLANGAAATDAATVGQVFSLIPIATQSEAEAGTVNTDFMTPLRTAQQRQKHMGYSIIDFGGVGDGVTINDSAILSAAAAGIPIHMSEGTFLSTLATGSLPARTYGRGQIQDSGGKRAPNFINQTAAPASYGANGSVVTAFNGDITHVHQVFEKRISGTTTLTQPATGYAQFPENASAYYRLFNQSGWNQDTASNSGRTGVSLLHLQIDQYGQGDAGGITFSGISVNSRAGATSFLANPAVFAMNGDFFTAATGSYIQAFEFNFTDNGFQAAAIAQVFNFHRSVTTSTLGEVWMGIRNQSVGSAAADVSLSSSGLWKRILDTTAATLDSDNAAITLAANQKIYLESVVSGTVGWSQTVGQASIGSDGSNINFNYGGATQFSVNATSVKIGGTAALAMVGSSQFSTGAKTATFTATNKPGANNTSPTQWMKVILNGFTFWVPCFPD